jgi:hypothetical protein
MTIIRTFMVTVLCGAITLLYAQSRVNELIKLKESGVDDNVLIAYIQSSPKGHALTADEIVDLKDAGISDAVIAEALRHAVNGPSKKAASLNTADGEPAPEEAAPEQPATEKVDKTIFEEALTPYGTWVLIDGVRYWRPSVAANNPDWAPYMTNGHWVYSDLGWTWVSDYPWGWAPFHYGRWLRHHVYGWVWWPDVTWGPAWVRWRSNDDYCGWAPLPPFSVFVPHHGFFFRGRFVDDAFDFGLTSDDFFFVPSRHFCDNDLWLRRVGRQHRHNAYENTVVIRNNFTYSNDRIINHGPSIDFVARVTHTEIRPVVVESHDVDRPGPHFRGVTVSPGKLVVERPHVSVIAPLPPPPLPPLPPGLPPPPLPPPPGVRVIDQTHQGRTVVGTSTSGFQPDNAQKSGLQKQSEQRSEGFKPADRQEEKKKGFHENRGRKNKDNND